MSSELQQLSDKQDRIQRLHMWRWRALTVWVTVFTILVAWVLMQDRRLSNEGKQARTGLCAYKASSERALDATVRFLYDHPQGLPGIPVEAVRLAIVNDQHTLDSLKKLDCP